ncbi:MAG: uroporphyrinogen-III C-methyltransferase [Pseudomonadota bacterium]|jgi:uroporphyrin-III C-methyltransferase/precorrin-2 dehydrogenase/sirohydrochlorin ferrochelatase
MTAQTPFPRIGSITLVGAGPGAADLLTSRAIDRMRKAHVIYYDRLITPDVLAMAGPHPRLVFAGKEVGAHSWPQHRINAAITAAALQGQHVVRLKSGDPSVFGRACEEIDAARALGIPVEVVPGITAASAAAASLCQPLTSRGVTDRVVLATATCRPGERMSDVRDIARPGSTLVFYMAMQHLPDLTRQLLEAGLAPDHAVTVATQVSTPAARVLHSTLAHMAEDCAAQNIRNPAVIMLALPKDQPIAKTAPQQTLAVMG